MPERLPTRNERHVNSDLLRWLLLVIGWLAIAAGLVGLFLPVVPTVPFLLLAVACFARSSERCHRWLVEHNHFGPLLRGYLHGGGIPLKAKRMAIGMVWISFPTSALLFVPVVWLKVVLLAVAVAITIYLISLPTLPPHE